jgi:phosphatidylserine decarboxylase
MYRMDDYSRAEPFSHSAFPIDRAGMPFIGIAAFATAVFALLGIAVLALSGLLATLFICYFFRDPDRVTPVLEGGVISPADGKIVSVERLERTHFTEGPCRKVSIFMSIFNVHVNRIPFDGRVVKIDYYPGKFFSANLDKASRLNEHNAVYLETKDGRTICFVQIAGLVARRIICRIQEGDDAVRGQRFGLICFGSRLDVYLPVDAQITVTVGDMVRAGTSLIGKLT